MVYKKELVLGSAGLFLLLASFVGIAALGDPMKHPVLFVIFYGASFLFWGMCVHSVKKMNERAVSFILPFMYATSALCAVLLLFTKTSISTDIYRYLWDGGLTIHYINPYLVTPEHVSLHALRDGGLYPLLDWKNEYTVYPPLGQILFVGAYFLYTIIGIIGAKILFAGGALISWWFSYRMFSQRVFLLMLINPMFLFESFNGGHLDIYVVAALLGTWYFFTVRRYTFSSICLAAAVLIKLYPLLFLPLFAVELGRRQGLSAAVRYSAICLSIIAVFYLPLLPHVPFLVERYAAWVGVMVFNPSAYALLLSFFKPFSLHAEIWASRVSAVGLVCSIGLLALRPLTVERLLLAALAFILFSSVVYPWYTLVALPFVFLLASTNERLRYPLLYALAVSQFLVSLTYINEVQSIAFVTRVSILQYIAIIEYGTLLIFIILGFTQYTFLSPLFSRTKSHE